MNLFLSSGSVVAIMMVGWACPFCEAHAQSPLPPDESANDDGEIIVTAQRRGERLQDVPITMQAFTGAALDRAGVKGLEDLAAITPGLGMQRAGAGSTPTVRGIGTTTAIAGTESPVSIYVDGVYYQSLYSARMALPNVERIELLKGPQGTLFGRNSTGGVIQVITRQPSATPTYDLQLSLGSFETYKAQAYVTGPITGDITADVTVLYQGQEKPYGINEKTGVGVSYHKEFFAGSKLRYSAGDTDVTIAGDYSLVYDPTGFNRAIYPGSRALGNVGPTGNFYNVDHNFDAASRTHGYGGSLTVNQGLGFASLTSITAYRDDESYYEFDNDYGPIDFAGARITMGTEQWTQELRLASDGSSRISWIVGGYFLSSRAYIDANLTGVGGAITHIEGQVKTRSFSAFGELGIQIGKNGRLTLGGRITHDERRTAGVVGTAQLLRRKSKWTEPTYRVVYDHHVTKNSLVYLSYNRGFKSGNFNILPATTPAFNPEYVDAFEIGVKNTLLDGKVRLNLAGFYYAYKDLQLTLATATAAITTNAAGAHVYGLDLDFSVTPVAGLTLDLAGSWVRSKYIGFVSAQSYVPLPTGGNRQISEDASGRPLIRSPRLTLAGGASYAVDTGFGTVTPRARVSYNSGFNWDTFGRTRQRAYTLVSAGLDWTKGKLGVSAQVNNLLDQKYAISGGSTGTGNFYVAGTPRVVMVTLKYSY